MQVTFAKIVQRHFQFLVNELGFSLLVATESPRGAPWEGDVQYMTNNSYRFKLHKRGTFLSMDRSNKGRRKASVTNPSDL